MRLGMLPKGADTPLNFSERFSKAGGIILPYYRTPTPIAETDTFVSHVDPNTGDVYETSPQPGQPGGDFIDTRVPGEVSSQTAPTAPNNSVTTTTTPTNATASNTAPQNSTSLAKPLLIVGAIVLGLGTLLKNN